MVKENNRDDGNVKLFPKIIGIASLLKNEPSTSHRSENWPSLRSSELIDVFNGSHWVSCLSCFSSLNLLSRFDTWWKLWTNIHWAHLFCPGFCSTGKEHEIAHWKCEKNVDLFCLKVFTGIFGLLQIIVASGINYISYFFGSTFNSDAAKSIWAFNTIVSCPLKEGSENMRGRTSQN